MSWMQMELEQVEWFLCQPPVVHPASKAAMNHLLWFRRCRRSELQTGVVRTAQSGTDVWTAQLRIASESCCLVTQTPISAARPAFSEGKQRDSLGEEPFQTSPCKQTQPTKPKPSWAGSFSWAVSTQRMPVRLWKSSHCCLCCNTIYSHIASPIP